MKLSPLQVARYQYTPKLPGMLRNGVADICVKNGEATASVADQEKIAALFPNTYGKNEITFVKGKNTSEAKKQVVGVILSGGQAPGGHNVVCGLYDALKATNKDNVLYGFKGGPSGLLEDNYLVFDDEYINQFRNTGGFDIIGSGRTKLETEEQFAVAASVCKKHGINAIVIIGGDDSNTNAAVLAEYFAAHNTGVQVIGCPKTIDGDLKNEDIECSFGFDTATKTYSEIIGNIERDANSAKKYWHFIKVMGRSASHVALECALETQPNVCLIGEEVAAKKMSLAQIADYIADSVANRAANGDNFGVAIIPEGIVEFVPEFSVLIAEINELLAGEKTAQFNALPTWEEKYAFIENGLTKDDIKLKAGIFGAEPWTNEMRRQIEEELGIHAYDIYGLTEIIGPGVAFECSEQSGMHVNEDHFIVEVIDPDTGAVLPDGEQGELVFTCITKEAFPILRYRTRDIGVIHRGKCACGRTLAKMTKPRGRTDDMLIIRGVNVFPSQIETVLIEQGYAPVYQIVVDRANNFDSIEVRVEISSEIFSDTVRDLAQRAKELSAALKNLLGIHAKVTLMEPNSLPRSEGKAVRVIDRRKLLD